MDSDVREPESSRDGASQPLHRHLPRLEPEHYEGYAAVHWSLTIHERAAGWLDGSFHGVFREMLLHAHARFHLVCPAYCLMPDHLHILWLGLRPESDQRVAVRFIRKSLRPNLLPCRFQKESYDHVLRGGESGRDGIREIAFYILANPVRAGIVTDPDEYPWRGCVLQGYPRLNVDDARCWPVLWRIVGQLRQ